jgi:glucosamine 6-phosphate synthetase-like amidotransferase/phosphosugar isomerase protein
LQFIAYYRALALDGDPDRPQHLTQVVTQDEQELVRAGA